MAVPNLFLLAAACVIAFARPVWGFGILLLLTSSLFHLDQYLTVSLGVGYIEPLEMIVISMCVSVWLRNLAPARTARRTAGIVVLPGGHLASRVLWIIGPYCLWQSLCIFRGLATSSGSDTMRLGLRFLLSGVLPWASLYVLAKLHKQESQKVFIIAYYIAFATACVHIGLQVSDYRPAMKAAYFWIPTNSEQDFTWMQQWINNNAFVRGLPQGILLILFFTLFKLSDFVVSRGKVAYHSLGAAIVLFSAILITVTRSYMLILAVGLAILLALAALARHVDTRTVVRCAILFSLFLAAGQLYDTARPGFFRFWSERITQFEGIDSQIFSQENTARGWDNLAALRAIGDHPLFGVGMPRSPSEYLLRDGPPTDTHPMLDVGLVGGIPAMLLIILMQIRLFLPFLKYLSTHPPAINESLALVSVLFMNVVAVNGSGGGGTLFGAPILFVTIFASELWNRCSIATPCSMPQYATSLVPY